MPVFALSSSDSAASRSSSENISFRLHKGQLDQLRQEAREKRISLNTLVNQIVDSYGNWILNGSKAGIIPISKTLLVELLEGYNEEQIKGIAERFQKKITIDLALQLRGKYDFEALVDIFASWLTEAGFPYRHIIDMNYNNRHTFITQYNMGRKFSLFQAETLKVYFEPLVTKKIECSITDNSVAITVEG
jgi:hypothetical protein